MLHIMYMHEQSLQEMLRKARQHNRKAKHHNTTRPKQSFFKERKNGCLGWDSNPQPSAVQAMLLSTKLLRQLSWLGQIHVHTSAAFMSVNERVLLVLIVPEL